MTLPGKVKIVEVGPRDGLQNEAQSVPAAIKIELIERLTDAGLKAVEAGAFVSPKWVPRMADTPQVMAGIRRREGVSYPVLVPNLQGFEAARAAGVEEIAGFAAASETFSRKNTNCTIQQSLERMAPLVEAAKAANIRVRGYVSVVLGCPYEGDVDPQLVADITSKLWQMGCYEVSLGDTIGVGTPGKTQRLIEACARNVPVERLGGHFHDTYGQALVNIYAAMEVGVSVFDASVAGLGGCPYAKGATGNVATEDVVYMLDGLGIETGIDLERLIDAAAFICGHLGRSPVSRAGNALLAKRARLAQERTQAACAA